VSHFWRKHWYWIIPLQVLVFGSIVSKLLYPRDPVRLANVGGAAAGILLLNGWTVWRADREDRGKKP
jgi:hypothetical protein